MPRNSSSRRIPTVAGIEDPRDRLASKGYALLPGVFSFDEANRDPAGFAGRILGEVPALVERQPIRPIADGRSFASSMMETPFHTDSQLALGVPPLFQLMLCVRPAAQGGESLLLDAWALMEAIRSEDPGLFRDLFEVERRQPFLFGDVFGPTVSRRGGHVVFTHSALARDLVAERLSPFLGRAPVIEIRPKSGDLLIVDNHRLLHGRRAFEDPGREFVRLLVYSRSPQKAPHELVQRAREVRPQPHPAPLSALQRTIVDEFLGGTPAGLIAHRERIPEAALYRWRDAVLASPQGRRLWATKV